MALNGGGPTKTPVAAVEWTGDMPSSVVYAGEDELLYYVTIDGHRSRLIDASSDEFTAGTDQGVA